MNRERIKMERELETGKHVFFQSGYPTEHVLPERDREKGARNM